MIGEPGLFRPGVDEIHISVTFDWDISEGMRLKAAWEAFEYQVKIGGPALDDPGGDFVPGRYLKPGYVITSRGCPNRCWFCKVWKREGNIREIPITEGWNVLDSNLLACSEKHILNVFDMLTKQGRRPEFTGGLDPERITPEIATELKRIKPRRIYTAYDTPGDYPHIVTASANLFNAGFTPQSHVVMCYVLIGYPRDTFKAARIRLHDVLQLGLTPMAMLYRANDKVPDLAWKSFQRQWVRPQLIFS